MTSKPDSVPAQHQSQQPGIQQEMTPKPETIRQNYRGSGKLEGKAALITGGDSGIGRSVAVHFAREGADVAIVYKPEEQTDAEDTRRMVEAEGRKCLLLPGDLRDAAFCQSIVEQTVSQLGQLNVLVNNAAEQHPEGDIEDITDEHLLSTYQTNIFSFFRVTRAALKHLQAGDAIINTTSVTAYRGSQELIDYSSTKGAIINTTSVTAYRGSQELIDYSSTKGAITSFTRSLSKQLAEKGIRVNAVAPGPIWTPLIPATFDEEKVGSFGKQVPMKRPGQPSEVGPAYVFLASEDASYFTGQVLHPNGGEVVNA